jgi:hypothetical protein
MIGANQALVYPASLSPRSLPLRIDRPALAGPRSMNSPFRPVFPTPFHPIRPSEMPWRGHSAGPGQSSTAGAMPGRFSCRFLHFFAALSAPFPSFSTSSTIFCKKRGGGYGASLAFDALWDALCNRALLSMGCERLNASGLYIQQLAHSLHALVTLFASLGFCFHQVVDSLSKKRGC